MLRVFFKIVVKGNLIRFCRFTVIEIIILYWYHTLYFPFRHEQTIFKQEKKFIINYVIPPAEILSMTSRRYVSTRNSQKYFSTYLYFHVFSRWGKCWSPFWNQIFTHISLREKRKYVFSKGERMLRTIPEVLWLWWG